MEIPFRNGMRILYWNNWHKKSNFIILFRRKQRSIFIYIRFQRAFNCTLGAHPKANLNILLISMLELVDKPKSVFTVHNTELLLLAGQCKAATLTAY